METTTAEIKLEPTERITFARERSESSENWVPLTERLDTAGGSIPLSSTKQSHHYKVPKS